MEKEMIVPKGDSPLAPFLQGNRVGYFSMEIALRSEIPTYSGGLGVLAGDTLRSAADLDIPLVAVTLVSRQGYFRQRLDAQGNQTELPNPWSPEDWAHRLPAKISVRIESREVWVGGWLYVLEGLGAGAQPVILLDCDLPENHEQDRRITDHLYGGDEAYRLKQEVVLGIGGVRMLEALGFRLIAYHLNEGHSALLTLQLLKRHGHATRGEAEELGYDVRAVRELCHFTTHTPVEAGHDRFSPELTDRILGNFIETKTLRRLGGEHELNTTRLALNLSGYVNGVAKRHAETSRQMFPGYDVTAVTNGVHPSTWAAPELAMLYDRYLPGWRIEPELLMRADCCLSSEALWSSHQQAKARLLELVAARCPRRLDPGRPLVGYGRRMTQYKRPDLLFTDLERLKSIAERQPFQIVLAGKAHPRDESGKRAIRRLHELGRALEGLIPVVFLPDYDMHTALAMVSGVDVWLNTPQPPMEASGTSGMKAALNGVPNLSVLDGWWLEGHIEGITGWAIDGGRSSDSTGDRADAASLYDKLENVVLPLYNDRERWLVVMKGAISRNASLFHSHRMMRRYAAEAYLG
jgi:glycogen phosphorylase